MQGILIAGGKSFEVSAAIGLMLPVASNWKVIGALLGIPNENLTRIASDETGIHNQLLALLNELSSHRPPPTWDSLANAVEHFNPDLADRIRTQ